jgi:hypothetical protein
MPLSGSPELPTVKAEPLSADAGRLARFLLSHAAIEAALRGPPIIDVHVKEADPGEADPAPPLFPDSITVAIDTPDLPTAPAVLDGLDAEQACILLRNVIQCVPDYRGFLASAFDKLAVGGFLIVTAPHQFLYERKLQVPSRYQQSHLRFYTPGTLLAEVEEALDPCRYRVRLLADHDAGFDYAASLQSVPAGGHDIVLCLEKIAAPPWRAAMEQDESQSAVYTSASPFLPPFEAEANAYRVIAPDNRQIDRLIVLKLDHRGDFMMAMPAFRILRHAFRAARITLVCGSWNRQEAEDLRLFDRVIAFDFFPEDVSAGPSVPSYEELCDRFAELVAGESFDAAIDLRLYEDTRELIKSIDARHRAGFDPLDKFPWLTIPLNLLIPTRDGRAEQGVMLATDFHTRIGEHHGFAMIFLRQPEMEERRSVLDGPYLTLKPGHYEFEVLIEPLAQEFAMGYDLAANDSRRMLGAGEIAVRRDRYPRFTFETTERIEKFEFRLMTRHAGPLPPFRFLGLRYRRYGAFVGVHQREAMALLAHLVALRLEEPYTVARL